MGTPRVSVIVPVHNCAPTLERTIRSVFEQTLAADLIEIIAVDDGSSDGGEEILDRLAAGRPGFTVVHQAASGGPGRPRNVGIERATGDYLFFLDADDWLGPEALERCCAMADANGTDVVVPKYVGVGRRVHPELFKENVEFTTIFDPVPNLYGSITALKLYRRTLIERYDIRFPEGVLSGEDQIFAVRAYFEAKGVSVLADYDCYYWVSREDGTSALQRGGAPAELYFPEIERLMAFVSERTPPGPVRDRLLSRHFSSEIFSRLGLRYAAFDEEERRATRVAARRLFRRHGNAEIMRGRSPYIRLIEHTVRHGLDDLVDRAAEVQAQGRPKFVFEGDDVFMAYPGLRDERYGIPDEVYAVAKPPAQKWLLTGAEWRDGRLALRGHSVAEALGEAPWSGELVLRRCDGTGEHRLPFAPVDTAADGRTVLGAEIDPAAAADGGPLPAGRYDVLVSAPYRGRDHEGRLTAASEDVTVPGAGGSVTSGDRPVVKPYLTDGKNTLALHVGGLAGVIAGVPRTEPSIGRPGTLRLTAVAESDLADEQIPVTVRALLRHRVTGDVRSIDMAVERPPGLIRACAEIDMTGAGRGKWDVSYEITAGFAKDVLRAPAPDSLDLRTKGTSAFRTVHGNLSITYAGGGAVRLLRRIARRVPA
ncbi:glycosyltransferase family 2 protein [Spirillospora sp. NPDC048819]|uniref:glycosyltransferase family 2 protein n=1 Tax=Spirillospora sp. NPDC048819 TaxID=3155268 RepID=UPI0033EC4570